MLPVPVPPTDRSRFGDVEEPTAALVAPRAPDGFRDPLSLFDDMTALASPTQWVQAILDLTLHINPLEWVVTTLAGDWCAFAECADIWRMQGVAYDHLASNIRHGNRELDEGWDGPAADAARAHFTRFEKALHARRELFDQAAEAYDRIARLVWEAAQAARGILGMMLDEILTAVTLIVAGAAMGETVIMPVVAWSLAAYQLARIVRLFGRLTDSFALAEVEVRTGIAVLGSLGVTLTAVPELPELPDLPARPQPQLW